MVCGGFKNGIGYCSTGIFVVNIGCKWELRVLSSLWTAVPATSISPEMDLLGSLSESFSSNSLALVPSGPATTTSEAAVLGNAGSAPASAAKPSGSAVMSQVNLIIFNLKN